MYSLGEKSAANFLMERAQVRNKSERSLAIGLIGTHGVVEAKPLLMKLLEDSKGGFRVNAINALAEMRDDSLVPLLQEIIEDTACSSVVKTEAQLALKRLSQE